LSLPSIKEVKMRYREINGLDDFSHDVAVVVDFIGEKEYRRALEKIGIDLNLKGFVTPFDDALYGLELNLLVLERLRTQCSGRFTLLPESCHAGSDFLLGLGQTIPALSEKGKVRLLGRIKKGLDEGLWPLRHELGVAANLNKRGWDIGFHDLEEGGGFDYLVAKDGMTYEVEAKAISAFTGWPLKPDNLYKLLVEVRQQFVWQGVGIPFLSATLPSSLAPDRTELRRLVSAFSTVARTKAGLDLPESEIRFVGIIPDMPPDKLMLGSKVHSRMRRKIVLVNANHPKLVLELDSKKPIQTGRKIIQTTNEAARRQFSRSRPAIIWTHINFISEQDFLGLGAQRDGRASLLDSVANGTLVSEKCNHLSQLVFSGGSFLHKTDSDARSCCRSIVYNSPMCRFGKNVIFEGGRMHPDHKAA
jgi:hypothetical protein